MKRGVTWAAALAVVLCFLCAALKQLEQLSAPVSASQPWTTEPQLILDAGHGGEDGGAVSVTGTPESQINLAIVLKMDDLLGFYGVSPVVLRREDISLHDSTAVTLREKKVSDLKNRVAAIQGTEQAVLLSIHQNSYPEEQYHGTQTFYAPTNGSQQLAEHIQTAVRETLQADNTRQAKQIPKTVYLMNHIDCPAVLIECGFLTNREEEAMLREEPYQKKLAAVLTTSWLTAPIQS